jgi:hypothetical protein
VHSRLKIHIKILFLLFLFPVLAFSQGGVTDSLTVKPDSVLSRTIPDISDHKVIKIKKQKFTIDSVKPFKPDPVKVVWMGAIIPGYGQILNRSYWKLPIVYAGFLGCAYAISWNSSQYEAYRLGYRDLTDTSDKTDSYLDLLPKGRTLSDYPNFSTNLKTAYEQYRRYRDLSVIVSVAYYALVIVEAYVDAQLFDFDISPDLSMRWSPAVLKGGSGYSGSPGFNVSLTLR